jgi:hypothetical protein
VYGALDIEIFGFHIATGAVTRWEAISVPFGARFPFTLRANRWSHGERGLIWEGADSAALAVVAGLAIALGWRSYQST